MNIDIKKLTESLVSACTWLTDIAQVKTDNLESEKNSGNLQHQYWKGTIRGEYNAAVREWDFYCPVWHTGQAVKALVKAYKILNDPRLLKAAESGAGFIGRQRINDKNDENYGLILAFEDLPDCTNTSAILECIDGLLVLGELSGNLKYYKWAEEAVKWVVSKAYIPGEGLFRDCFSLKSLTFIEPSWYTNNLLYEKTKKLKGRPLLDDAILLKLSPSNPNFKEIFYETADRLLLEENPPGNWVNIVPAHGCCGPIHPRHAYWWGLPMIDAYKGSNDSKYLDCAIRCGEWYIKAQRYDGGLFRNTYIDFNTDSFGHATSGVACSAILWQELYRITGEEKWLKATEKSLQYCMNVQFRDVEDLNLKGAILEKVQPPDGTDKLPYHIRDLGTIFYIQAASKAISIKNNTIGV